MEISFDQIIRSFGWQLGIAAFFFGMTSSALDLLSREKKETIALWLMGAGSEENWSKSFISLFDALFGERHFSFHCLVRSSIASLISVSLIWGLMFWSGTLDRIEFGATGFGTALAVGIALNIIADYVSLLETRYLIGNISSLNRSSSHAVVLLLDFVVTAAIVMLTIAAFQKFDIIDADHDDWLSIGLALSIYSAPFYSTFLTSIWTWFFIVSTFVIRLFIRFRLAEWIDVEHRPTLIVSLVLSAFVLVGAFAVDAITSEDDTGLSPLDAAVCEISKGSICEKMKRLTADPETLFLLQSYACEGGLTDTCLAEGIEAYNIDSLQAARLFRAACTGHELRACHNLAVMYLKSIGVEKDVTLAAHLYETSCNGGFAHSCFNLGLLSKDGNGIPRDLKKATEYFQESCDYGYGIGCTTAGKIHFGILEGPQLAKNDAETAYEYFARACKLDAAEGCWYAGLAARHGNGREQDLAISQSNINRSCELGFSPSCKYAKPD